MARTFWQSTDSRQRPLTLAALDLSPRAGRGETSAIVLAARLRARAMPTPSREARRPASERKPKGWGPGFSMAYAVFANSNSNEIKIGSRTPTDTGTTTAPSGAAPPCGAARLSASHHGSHQRDSSSLRLSFRPGFLGRGLSGRYPPSPVPVQGSTSRPGHNAGRHDAQAAREQGG